jgi:hypothetical protein
MKRWRHAARIVKRGLHTAPIAKRGRHNARRIAAARAGVLLGLLAVLLVN